MLMDNLSHLTYYQFFTVIYLLLIFCLSTISSFFIIYFVSSKTKLIILLSIIQTILFTALLIETANTPQYTKNLISLFRALNILVILHLVYLRNYVASFIHGAILFLSFYFHYLTIYLLFIPIIYYWIKYKPKKLNITIETKASQILNELKEAVIICNETKILEMNPIMKQILNIHGECTITEVSTKLFSDRDMLQSIINNNTKLKDYYPINSDYYKININQLKKHGLIITATNITGKIDIQNEYKSSILELEDLNKKLRSYSKRSESLGINNEKAQIYSKIEGIVNKGLQKLKEDLISISNTPPDSYEIILNESRILLNEIRELVNSWRSVKGDNS